MKAVNYLLPHIQRVPSRIVRDELAREIAQKLGIDSAVLRQELRHAASNRSTSAVKGSGRSAGHRCRKYSDPGARLGAGRFSPATDHISARDGADEEFDPARQAQYAFQNEGLHRGLATESLVDALLNAEAGTADVMDVPGSDSERRLLASILLKEDEELTPELLERAVRALRKIRSRRQIERVQRELKALSESEDITQKIRLSEEALRLKLALRDPGLA